MRAKRVSIAPQAPEQREHRVRFRFVCNAQPYASLDRACCFASLGARCAEARAAIGARARCALGELQERARERAPELVGHRAVAARQIIDELLAQHERFERDVVGVEAVMSEDPAAWMVCLFGMAHSVSSAALESAAHDACAANWVCPGIPPPLPLPFTLAVHRSP
jgi:hypothetical protein